MKWILSIDIRKPLAFVWTSVAAFILIYALVVYGNDKATLNLILGIIGGSVIGGIFGYYFSDSAKKQDYPPSPVAPARNDVEVNVN